MSQYDLPQPETEGQTSVEGAIEQRASRRSFADAPVSIDDVAQLLWAAQGITHERDGIEMRAVPSAGATYPSEVFLDVAPDGCEDLPAGLYRYEPSTHDLEAVTDESVHEDVVAAAYSQPVVAQAPVTLAVAADYERTVSEYPDHGRRYVHMEAGHIAQNVHLVCEARDLYSCPVGAFADEQLDSALSLPPELDPLYLVPVGRPPES